MVIIITWGHAGPLGHMTHHMICRNAFFGPEEMSLIRKTRSSLSIRPLKIFQIFQIFRRLRGENFIIWIMSLQSYQIDLSWPSTTGPNFTLTQKKCVKSGTVGLTGENPCSKISSEKRFISKTVSFWESQRSFWDGAWMLSTRTGQGRVEDEMVGSRRWNWKFREKHFWNPNFCYIQVIVFDLSYLPVAVVGT